jgi:regulator of extracellular matrix RemA (YlzA/DUF370 family)
MVRHNQIRVDQKKLRAMKSTQGRARAIVADLSDPKVLKALQNEAIANAKSDRRLAATRGFRLTSS